MINVAINGFGRIGRAIFRAGWDDKKINFVAVNDLMDTKQIAYLLQYDSVYGQFKHKIGFTKNSLKIGNKTIKVFNSKDPQELPWKELKIDVVIESSGLFLTTESAGKHLIAGAKKVLLSAPAKDDKIKTYLYGVNHQKYKKSEKIISNASCTTNCLAPIVNVLNKKFGVVKGLMTTIHAYTISQKLLDSAHKDYRRGRCAALNMIPTTTGAAKSIGKVIPEMKGKLDGMSIRVPIADGSLVDLTVQLKKKVTVDDVNQAIKKSNNKVIEYCTEPLVSSDIIGNPHSAIFDSLSTMVLDNNFVKVLAWYDNEWGYSNRMIDMIKIM
jgi:glyceraldehyde 3-phosphate dehydrogenase